MFPNKFDTLVKDNYTVHTIPYCNKTALIKFFLMSPGPRKDIQHHKQSFYTFGQIKFHDFFLTYL